MIRLKKAILFLSIVFSLFVFYGTCSYAQEVGVDKELAEGNVAKENSVQDVSDEKYQMKDVIQSTNKEAKDETADIGGEQDNELVDYNVEKNAGNDSKYYNPGSFLVNNTTALLFVTSNDNNNIEGVDFAVWTGNGSDMRGYRASLQGDGRWMTFLSVKDYGKSGTYYCLASVRFKDGHSQTLNLISFDVMRPSIGAVTVENINSNAGTFDIKVSNVNCLEGVDYIEVLAFTKQDFSDVYAYRAYKEGASYVAHANVGYHKYNYGTFGIFATVHSNNNTTATISTCGTISKPEVKISTYDIDGNSYFLIAENLPYESTCTSVNFYVWNQGISDLRGYKGFRDGNRWLAIFSVTDYMKDGKYSFLVNGQQIFGPEITYGGSSFDVRMASAKSIWAYGSNNKQGTIDVMITGVKGVGGVKGISELVLTKPDFSDAHSYGAVNCGNGNYLFQIDVANHNYNYGTFMIVVYVTNEYGIQCEAGTIFYKLDHPNSQFCAIPVHEQSDVSVGAWALPYEKHIIGVQFFVWNSGNDIKCYTTNMRQNDGSYNYVFSMNDFGKMGTFYVLPKIIRDNWTTEDLGLTSFTITQLNNNYGIMGSSGTTVDQMVRFFNNHAQYPLYYIAYSDAKSIRDMCQIFFDECALEGVRAEVAFCQAMLETGWLQFGGAVDIAAYNFAGIGAVDSSPGSYNWFPDVRTGARAQVQHLKAYASYDPLNQWCVDPRFNYVDRGCAPYVESLGNGKWASSASYGSNIRGLINMLFSS